MAQFSYKSVDGKGRTHTGTMEAANESDLEQRLNRMGLDLVKSRFVQNKGLAGSTTAIRRIDLINFCFHMEQLTRSGVSIVDGLQDLRDSVENAAFRSVIAEVVEKIETGLKLSQALSEHPKVFDEMFVNLIAAGEESGQLPEVFNSLNTMIKWQDELIATTKKLLIFPIFVGVAVFAVVGFLMVYLVPQLVSFIEGIGETLPFHTRALIATSDFVISYWWLFTVVPVLVFVLLRIATTLSKDIRYRVDGYKLKVWEIGPVLKKIILSRFANTFAMMYKAGIPILHCIEVAEKVVGNEAIRVALVNAREHIQDGLGVSASFESTGLFPPLVVRMIRVGETTGQLDQALMNVSYFYNRDIKDSIEKVQALIQPVMTVLLGGILMWVMLSVMGPIYDSISNLQM